AQVAAVLGREFSYELLQAVAGVADDALGRGVERLVEAELVPPLYDTPHTTDGFKHALVQDAPDQSPPRRTPPPHPRPQPAVRVERFPETTETQPELVAHHFAEAGLAESAVAYWQRAGQRALERSANVEAVGHVRRALDLLRTRVDTPERARQELELQTILGS